MTSPLFRSGGAFRHSSPMAPHRRKASSIAPAKPALDETVANSRAERCHARRVIERGMHITGAERGTSDARVRAPGWEPAAHADQAASRGLRLRREGVEIFQ